MSDFKRKISIHEILDVLFFYKRMIVGMVLLATIGAILHVSTVTELYRATALVRLDQKEEKVILSQQIRQNGITRPTRFEFVLDEIQMLRSDLSIRKALLSMPGLNEEDVDRLRAKVAANLHVVPTNKTTVITVTYEDPDPEFAVSFLNALITGYLEINSEIRNNDDIIAYYSQQIDHYQSQVDSLSEDIIRLKTSGNIYDEVKQRNAFLDEITRIQAAIKVERRESEDLLFDRGILGRAMAGPSEISFSSKTLNSISVASLFTLQTQIAEEERDLADLLLTFAEQNAVVQSKKNQIQLLHEQYNAEIASLVRLTDASIELSESRLQELNAQLIHAQDGLGDLASLSDRLAVLERSRDADLVVLDNLIAKNKELAIDSYVEGRNLQAFVLKAPSMPSSPHSPNVFRIVSLSFLLSAFLSVLLAFYRRALSPVFTSPADTERVLDVQVVATVPLIDRK